MNEETPKPPRRRSPYTRCVDSVLVRFTSQAIPHDSAEFRERASRVVNRPQPKPGEPMPGEQAPPAG